jgi:DNA-binding MarR family transcriptional regulator
MALRPDPTLSEEIGRGIMRVRRLILREAGQRLEERGEDILTYQVLNFLDRCGSQTQSELAAGTGQHATGLSRRLDELDRLGLVRRARDSRDRRKVRVETTAGGRRLLTAVRPTVHAAVDQVLGPLGMGERRALRDLLQRMLEA